MDAVVKLVTLRSHISQPDKRQKKKAASGRKTGGLAGYMGTDMRDSKAQADISPSTTPPMFRLCILLET
jgi:hypothetical protein